MKRQEQPYEKDNHITFDEFLKMLKGREEFLVKEIEKREKRLDKAPAGTLRISKKGKTQWKRKIKERRRRKLPGSICES